MLEEGRETNGKRKEREGCRGTRREPDGSGTCFVSSWGARCTAGVGLPGVFFWELGESVGEREGQGREWSELGLWGALPGSSRTRVRGSGLGAWPLARGAVERGTEGMLSGRRGLASEKRGGGLALVRVGEGER